MSSYFQIDLPKYTIKAGLWFLGMSLYNSFVTKIDFMRWEQLKDSAFFALSNVSSGIISDLVFDMIGNKTGLQGMILEPLINAFVYPYLYDMYIYRSLSGGAYVKSNQTNMILGGVGNVILKYVENPLMSLFGIKSY